MSKSSYDMTILTFAERHTVQARAPRDTVGLTSLAVSLLSMLDMAAAAQEHSGYRGLK